MAVTQKHLLEVMKGQEFHINGLRSIYSSTWPINTHPDYERMKVVVDKYLEEYALPFFMFTLPHVVSNLLGLYRRCCTRSSD
jgi:hypothetical protein